MRLAGIWTDFEILPLENEQLAKNLGAIWGEGGFYTGIKNYLPTQSVNGCGYSLIFADLFWPTIQLPSCSMHNLDRFRSLQEKAGFTWPTNTKESDRFREIVANAAVQRITELMESALRGINGLTWKVQREGLLYQLGTARGVSVKITSNPLSCATWC